MLPVVTQVSVQLSLWALHPETVQPLRAVRIPCYQGRVATTITVNFFGASCLGTQEMPSPVWTKSVWAVHWHWLVASEKKILLYWQAHAGENVQKRFSFFTLPYMLVVAGNNLPSSCASDWGVDCSVSIYGMLCVQYWA